MPLQLLDGPEPAFSGDGSGIDWSNHNGNSDFVVAPGYALGLDSNGLLNTNSLDSVTTPPNGLDEITTFDGLWETLPAFDDFMAAFSGPFSTVSEIPDVIPQTSQASQTSSDPTLAIPNPAPPDSFGISKPQTPHSTPLPPTPPPSTGTSSSSSPSRPKTMVTIRPEDREPLQHFLTTMGQFVKLRSSNSDNIYCYIFTNMALAHPPLYESILAWSALHMAHVQNQSAPTSTSASASALASTSSSSSSSPSSLAADSERRYERALQYLYQDNEDGQAATERADWTFVTIWFLLQYELFQARGVDRFVALLDYAGDIVEALVVRYGPSALQDQLEPVAVRVLIWLGAYASRAATFGGGKHLLQCLARFLSSRDSDFFKTSAETGGFSLANQVCSSGGHPRNHQAGHGAPSPEMQACLRLALRVHTDRGQCCLLGRWRAGVDDRDEATQAEITDGWHAILTSMVTVKRWLETNHLPAVHSALRVAAGDMDMDRGVVPSSVGALDFNWMQLIATFNGCIITYHTNRPPSFPAGNKHRASFQSLESVLPTASESAACILRLTRYASLSRPNSPQCIWPQLLFQAGMETTDPIYQSWAVSILVQAEGWSPNLRRTRHLLERIIQRRRQVQGPCNVVAVMEVEGGKFIL